MTNPLHWTVTCLVCGPLYDGTSNRDADLAAARHDKAEHHATVMRGTPAP